MATMQDGKFRSGRALAWRELFISPKTLYISLEIPMHVGSHFVEYPEVVMEISLPRLMNPHEFREFLDLVEGQNWLQKLHATLPNNQIQIIK